MDFSTRQLLKNRNTPLSDFAFGRLTASRREYKGHVVFRAEIKSSARKLIERRDICWWKFSLNCWMGCHIIAFYSITVWMGYSGLEVWFVIFEI
ncbi:hypothetical protein CEXT_49481 [Caerostris extrusa]|uniref:Uncharacterized protein n=1 Tax=Caerostris extrusa TaxID=172846 RepID=A0AAV4UTA1_CAEEX|nr:hypothetical protein CEXT_49481 [Caerostris extrusa]